MNLNSFFNESKGFNIILRLLQLISTEMKFGVVYYSILKFANKALLFYGFNKDNLGFVLKERLGVSFVVVYFFTDFFQLTVG